MYFKQNKILIKHKIEMLRKICASYYYYDERNYEGAHFNLIISIEELYRKIKEEKYLID
jgi:hypothetical protein